MSLEEVKTVGYLNVLSNDLSCSEIIYRTRKEAIDAINKEISEKILACFGVTLEKKYMFSEIQNVSENRITTKENNSILLIKNTDTIDVYLCKINRGYIYNSQHLIHYFKFFINNHTLYEKLVIPMVISPTLSAKLKSKKIKHTGFVEKNDELIRELKERLEKLKISC